MVSEDQQHALDCKARSELVAKINGAAAEVLSMKRRVAEAEARIEKVLNAAKSELGTARRELSVASEQYETLRGRLTALLPSLDGASNEPAALDEAAQ